MTVKEPVTIRDIARSLGISHATVSRVLNGRAKEVISEPTRQRVLAAAAKLGYNRNYHARALQLGRADAIGMAMFSAQGNRVWEQFWGPLYEGVAGFASTHGKEFVGIGASVDIAASIERCVQRLQERRIDCLVVPGMMPHETDRAALLAPRAPIVVAEPVDGPRPGLHSVRLDSAAGIRDAVEHLAGLGHRRIGWFGPPYRPGQSAVRVDAFREAARARRLATVELILPDSHPERPESRTDFMLRCQVEARGALAAVAASDPLPTAVVCYNEFAAMGVYAAAAELGLAVPRDLSVIGFDDLMSDTTWPPMTVVSHRMPDIGWRAAEIALQLSEGAVLDQTDHTLPATLVVRASTAPPRER